MGKQNSIVESLEEYFTAWIKETARIRAMLKLIHTENKLILKQLTFTSKTAQQIEEDLTKTWDELDKWDPEIKI